jgi:hypothetical protein
MNLLECASRFRTLALACLAFTLMGARADVVTDWNVTALTATEAASPQAENRILAMAHVAMFDAANATTRTRTPVASQPAGRALRLEPPPTRRGMACSSRWLPR